MRSDLVTEKPRVGCIGTGSMGGPLASHILRAGFPLTIHNRTHQRAKGLLDSGATWAASLAETCQQASIILTITGSAADVRELYLGASGLVALAQAGSILVNLTTSDPNLAVEIHAAAALRGIHALDAPQGGGSQKGAIEGRLGIMAGGDEAAFHRAEAVLRTFGTPRLLGGPGKGQLAKLAQQVTLASSLMGVCESLAFMQTNGLDPAGALECLNQGMAASWVLQHLAPHMVKADSCGGLDVSHFIQDLKTAQAQARYNGLSCPGLDTAVARFEQLVALGGSDLGMQALYRLYARPEALNPA